MARSEATEVMSRSILPRRMQRLEQVVAGRTRRLVVVLENLHDSHNLSAVLRSAEGFGVQEVHVVETGGPLEIAPKITQGCHKWLDIYSYPDAASCVDHLHARGFELWAAALEPGAASLTDIDFSRPVALVLGNEKLGLTRELLDLCDHVYRIPMRGFVQSFNISVAAAISLFYATLPSTVTGGGVEPGLEPEEAARLRERWLALSVKQRDRIQEALRAPSEESDHD